MILDRLRSRCTPRRIHPREKLAALLAIAWLFLPVAFGQTAPARPGGTTPVDIGTIINNLPPGTGNIINTIISNNPAGTAAIISGGLLNSNGTVNTTPTIATASGLLAGDTGTASVVIPSQGLSAITSGATNPNTILAGSSTNVYLWTISGGTITSDPTKASITYTATAGGTLILSVDVTVIGSSPVTATSNVSVISPDLAGKITAPSNVVTGNTTSSASVPAAQNADRTFRWTITGDAAIVGSATGATVNFRPGTPGVKDLACAVTLQRLATVTLHSYVVVAGSGAPVLVTVNGGTAGGTYPGGSRVDVFADPPAAGQVFDKWTGDTTALGTGALAASLPHVVITVPATPVTLTATYKAAPTWTPTVVTGFNPQTQTNTTTGQTNTLTTSLAYYIPSGAAGVVFLLHDTNGTAASWFNTPERALLVRDLVAAGYGVAALNNVNRNTGAWNLQAKLADNFDALNVAAALDKFAKDGALVATKPVFLLGEVNGADAAANYAELLVTSRPVKGVVLYLATGSETLAVTSHVPQLYALAANDDNISPAGNTTARNNSQLLAGRGVATGASTSAFAPVHPGRFRNLGVTSAAFTTADATAIWNALKTASYFDANNYLVKFPTIDELKADLPAAQQARTADVASELSVAFAASEFYSENDARVIAFLNTRVAGTAAPTPGRLANLSTLGKIYSVGDSFALGFTIGGGTEKATLLIRGIGPALAKFGVGTAIAAPQLEVYSSSNALLVTNQGWEHQSGALTPAQLTSAMASVGAFALAPGDADSAVVLTLSPGSYTVTVKGVNGATGDVLAEVYDVSKNSTRLTNLATLAAINNDGDMLVPGIVVQGANPRTLLVRAVGPGLGDLGFQSSALLGDPRITVLNGSTTVATNNNWSQGGAAAGPVAALSAAFPLVGAFPLKTGTADAALVNAFAAGNFTLQADAAPLPANPLGLPVVAPNSTGTVLVEVYEVP